MNWALWRKNLIESQWLLWSCAGGLFAFAWVRVWMVSLLEMERFKAIFEQFRALEHLSPVPFDLFFTWPGRVSLAFDEPLVWGIVSVWAIARGSDCVSGELGRGTMEMLLAQPLSRMQILLTSTLVTWGGLLVLGGAVLAGMAVSIQTTQVKVVPPAPKWGVTLPGLPAWEFSVPGTSGEPIREPLRDYVTIGQFLPGVLNLLALGFFLCGLATLVSACDRYRSRTLGIVGGVFAVSLAVKLVARAAQLNWLLYTTFFTAYEPSVIILQVVREPAAAWAFWVQTKEGGWQAGPLTYDLSLVGMGLAAYLAGAVIFARRDLPAPL